MVRAELERKLGAAILRTFDVEQHHPYENLVDLGRSSRGTPIRLNRTFCDADLKMVVGGVMPHPYMGFGGGAKLVVPGLAGIETLQANHQPAVTGISGGLAQADVEARRDVEEIALNAGLAFSVNAVTNCAARDRRPLLRPSGCRPPRGGSASRRTSMRRRRPARPTTSSA